MLAHHRPGSQLDKVDLGDLAHERETARRAQVALNHLHEILLGEELDVERAGDIQRGGYLARHALYVAHSLHVDLLRRIDDGGIAAVDAGKFDMLRNRIGQDVAAVGHCVELNLLAALHELAHHHGMFLGNLRSHGQEALQVVVAVADVHRSARKHVGRAHQHRIAHLIHKRVDVGQ